MTPAIGGKTQKSEKLSSHSTIRIGGVAQSFFLPSNEEELFEILAEVYSGRLPSPVHFFGKGSNVLFSDKGLCGTVVSTKRMMDLKVLSDGSFLAQAGVMMPYLAKVAAVSGRSGFSFMSGIPGTVGGGVAMNAGTPEGDFSRVVKEIRVLTPTGGIQKMDGSALCFGYRRSVFSPFSEKKIAGDSFVLPKGCVILDVLLSGEEGDPVSLSEKGRESLARRSETQPLDKPSLGSVFRNPASDYAGRLIEFSGLKGLENGGIRVSPKHGNFFINEGRGTAVQFLDLMEEVRHRVFTLTGQVLTPEVETMVYSGRPD